MTERKCDELCSHNQTPETLRALGYEVPELRRDAPVIEKAAWQNTVSHLIYRAQIEHKVRLCTRTERIVEHEKSLAKEGRARSRSKSR